MVKLRGFSSALVKPHFDRLIGKFFFVGGEIEKIGVCGW